MNGSPDGDTDNNKRPHLAHDLARGFGCIAKTIVQTWFVIKTRRLLADLDLPYKIFDISFWPEPTNDDSTENGDRQARHKVQAGNLPAEEAKEHGQGDLVDDRGSDEKGEGYT